MAREFRVVQLHPRARGQEPTRLVDYDLADEQQAREWADDVRSDYPHATVIVESREVEPWEPVDG